jgi:two-component system cell cycle sensor histidine kinase/response regulator CckA
VLDTPSGEFDLASSNTQEIMRHLLEEARETAPAPVQPAPGRTEALGGTLLLVEDEASVRAIAREMLLASGYTVIEAASGPEALALAERSAAPIDLMITDVVMPGMSGGELTEKLRMTRPRLRVLYTSGHADEAVDQLGVSRSHSTFLRKPFTYEAFVGKVRESLGARDAGDDELRKAS